MEVFQLLPFEVIHKALDVFMSLLLLSDSSFDSTLVVLCCCHLATGPRSILAKLLNSRKDGTNLGVNCGIVKNSNAVSRLPSCDGVPTKKDISMRNTRLCEISYLYHNLSVCRLFANDRFHPLVLLLCV